MQLSRQQIITVLAAVLVIAIGAGGYLIGRNTAPATAAAHTPPNVALPPHATLTRTETYFIDNVQNWYYSVATSSEDTLIAFYQARLPQDGWRCVTAMKTTHMTYYGQTLAGTGVYLTALRGTTKAQIYLGDHEYGAFLLSDDLPDGATALKLSFEPTKATTCSGA